MCLLGTPGVWRPLAWGAELCAQLPAPLVLLPGCEGVLFIHLGPAVGSEAAPAGADSFDVWSAAG